MGKGSKGFLVDTVQAYWRGSMCTSCTSPYSLNFVTRWRWVVNYTPRPISHQQRTPVLTEQKAGWPPDLVLTFWRRERPLVPTGIRTPDHPACSLVTIPTILLWLMILRFCWLNSWKHDIYIIFKPWQQVKQLVKVTFCQYTSKLCTSGIHTPPFCWHWQLWQQYQHLTWGFSFFNSSIHSPLPSKVSQQGTERLTKRITQQTGNFTHYKLQT